MALECYFRARHAIIFNEFGGVSDSTCVSARELHFVGYVYVKTLQLNITANKENSYALAA